MPNIAESNQQVQEYLAQINIQTIHQDSKIASIVSIGNQDNLFSPYCASIYPLSNSLPKVCKLPCGLPGQKTSFKRNREPPIYQRKGANGTVVQKLLHCLPTPALFHSAMGSHCSARLIQGQTGATSNGCIRLH